MGPRPPRGTLAATPREARCISALPRILLALTSGGLLAVPLHLPRAWFLASVALVPWIVAARSARPRLQAGLAIGVGLVYGAGVAGWAPSALRSQGASPLGSWSAALLAVAAVKLPVFLGLGAAIALGRYASLGCRCGIAALTIFAIETWVSVSGVPWALLGHTQWGALGVAQLALVGGVPLISALLVASNLATAEWIGAAHRTERARAFPPATALAAAVFGLAACGVWVAEAIRATPASSGSSEWLVVQPNLPRGDRWVARSQPLHLERVRDQTRRAFEAGSRRPDAVVLPENLLTTPLDGHRELEREVTDWVTALGTPVLTGMVMRSETAGRYRNAALWIAPRAGIVGRLDKERAVPVVESGSGFPGRGIVSTLIGAAGRGLRVEEETSALPLRGPHPVVVALCFEALLPSLVAGRRTQDSVAIVHLADDRWVGSETVTDHVLAMARYRAIEQRLPLLRVAHGGRTAHVDPYGRIARQLPLDRYASLRVKLPTTAVPPTHRERVAILALPVGFGCVAGGLARSFVGRSRRHRG